MSRALVFLAFATLTACAPISYSGHVEQPTGRNLEAGIGDTVMMIKTVKSMPNAFGRADIFGRTTPTGMVSVQFLGVQGNIAKFVRHGVDIETAPPR